MRSIYGVRTLIGRFHPVRPLLTSSALLAGVIALAGVASARPTLATLIDFSGKHDASAAFSCPSALSDLRDALDAINIPTQRITAPTVDILRLTLAQISGQSGGGRMIVVCGYGATLDNQVFAVPSDLSGNKADISRSGVSADTISRVAGGGGLTVLELHSLQGHDLSDGQVHQWQTAAEIGTLRLAGVDRNAGGATSLNHLTAALKGQGDASLSVFFGVQPQAAPSLDPSVSALQPTPVAASSPPIPSDKALPVSPDEAPDGKVSAANTGPAATASKTVKSAPTAPMVNATSPVDAHPAPVKAVPARAAVPASPSVKSKPVVVVRRPDVVKSDPQMRAVQLGLLAAGVYHGTVTGKNNGATTSAVKLYQKRLGHPATGQLSQEEQKALTGG